jgi:RHS repeat-associated protein
VDGKGKSLGKLDYGPYGEAAKATGQATDFRYANMFYLPRENLYLTHYRFYDPDTARWLNRDPIGEIGGLNLYGYVGGNPVNFVDPTGENWGSVFLRGIVIVIGLLNQADHQLTLPDPQQQQKQEPKVPGQRLPDSNKSTDPLPQERKEPSKQFPSPKQSVPKQSQPGFPFLFCLSPLGIGLGLALYSPELGGPCVDGCCSDEICSLK